MPLAGRPRIYHNAADKLEARRKQTRLALRRYRQKRKEQTISPETARSDPNHVLVETEGEISKRSVDRPSLSSSQDLLQCTACNELESNPVLTTPGCCHKDRQMFDYFQHAVVPQLRGYVSSRFWDCAVLQGAHASSAIQHAITALASVHGSFTQCIPDELADTQLNELHEQVVPIHKQSCLVEKSMEYSKYIFGDNDATPGSEDELADVGQAYTPKWTAFGLAHYNHAIRDLLQQGAEEQVAMDVNSNPTSYKDVLLISSILFACIETLLSNQATVLTHVSHGLAVLQDEAARIYADGPASSTSRVDHTSPHPGRIESDSSFSNTLQSLYQCTGAWLHHPELCSDEYVSCSMPLTSTARRDSFHTLEDAKSALDILSNRLAAQPTSPKDPRCQRQYPVLLSKSLQHDRVNAFTDWESRLGSWEQRQTLNGQSLSHEDRLAVLSMRAKCAMWKVVAQEGIHNDMISCKMNNELEKVVALYEELVDMHRIADMDFMMDDMTIQSMWVIALKCTDNEVAERALDVMRQLPKRICLWDTQLTITTLERARKARCRKKSKYENSLSG